MPSTFAELMVFDRMLERSRIGRRGGAVRGELESGFATVFRQVMMARYEQRAYALRAAARRSPPSGSRRSGSRRTAVLRGLILPDGYRFGWTYIPHFISTRFYTYAYVFAHLASLVLYALYREQGEAFVGPYVEFLGQGGAADPGHSCRRSAST